MKGIMQCIEWPTVFVFHVEDLVGGRMIGDMGNPAEVGGGVADQGAVGGIPVSVEAGVVRDDVAKLGLEELEVFGYGDCGVGHGGLLTLAGSTRCTVRLGDLAGSVGRVAKGVVSRRRR